MLERVHQVHLGKKLSFHWPFCDLNLANFDLSTLPYKIQLTQEQKAQVHHVRRTFAD